MSSDESREGRDSSEQSGAPEQRDASGQPASQGPPGQADQSSPPEEGGPTPYAGYGSPGVHPIPSAPRPPTAPAGPASSSAPGGPPASPAPGSPPATPPPDVTGPPPTPTNPGPPYPGETYPVYPPGQPVNPGQPAYPPSQLGYQPGQSTYPPGQPAYPGRPGTVAQTARPGKVTAGVIMSWVGGCVFVMFGLLLFALAANNDLLDGVEQQLGQQLNRDQATTVFRTLGVGLGIWGIAVIVFAALAWNGKNWARIVLTAMGGCYCASQLVGIASGALAGLLFLAYVVIAVGLLWTREARSWYATRAYDGSGEPKPPPIVW